MVVIKSTYKTKYNITQKGSISMLKTIKEVACFNLYVPNDENIKMSLRLTFNMTNDDLKLTAL